MRGINHFDCESTSKRAEHCVFVNGGIPSGISMQSSKRSVDFNGIGWGFQSLKVPATNIWLEVGAEYRNATTPGLSICVWVELIDPPKGSLIGCVAPRSNFLNQTSAIWLCLRPSSCVAALLCSWQSFLYVLYLWVIMLPGMFLSIPTLSGCYSFPSSGEKYISIDSQCT